MVVIGNSITQPCCKGKQLFSFVNTSSFVYSFMMVGASTISSSSTLSSSPSSSSSSNVLCRRVIQELATLQQRSNSNSTTTSTKGMVGYHHRKDASEYFPPNCLKLLYTLQGNNHCMDCGRSGYPEWASISYGCLLCLSCSGKHRSYGVHTSFVRSIRLDSWTYEQVITMLEGGNQQLYDFFARHQMVSGCCYKNSRRTSTTSHGGHGDHQSTSTTQRREVLSSSLSINQNRYHTKAAQFYRTHLRIHVQQIVNHNIEDGGQYLGRDAYRHYSSANGMTMTTTTSPSSTSTTSKTMSCSSSSSSSRSDQDDGGDGAAESHLTVLSSVDFPTPTTTSCC